MKKFSFVLLLVVASVFVLSSIAVANDGFALLPARYPSILISPDHEDSFRTPSGHEGRKFESDEGYAFSYDSMGRRMYDIPYSYAVEHEGRIKPVEALGHATLVVAHPVPTTVLVDGLFITR